MILEGRVEFQIHDKYYSVGNELEPGTKLNDYIRNYVNLKGTKFMCLEGGCGACIIIAKKTHPVTKKEITFSVNSCLVPIFVCHGWRMTTIEGIGNRKNGFNKLQSTLAAYNGSQCGHCSPGMVMSMYSTLTTKGGKITSQDVENSFSSNICRCTGYVSILNSFKSLAVDGSDHLKRKLADIEDVTKNWLIKKELICENGKRSTKFDDDDDDEVANEPRLLAKSFCIRLMRGNIWYKVLTVNEIFQVFDTLEDDQTYTLVAGNTAFGVDRSEDNGDVHIEINDVPELHRYTMDGDNLVLGANMTLVDTIDAFRNVAKNNPTRFGYLTDPADHLELVANTSVRNIGTLAGNLSIKHDHHDFPSDVFIILEAAGAVLTIGQKSGITDTYGLQEYMYMDMRYKVIRNIVIPGYDSSNYFYRSFKIMQRAQNTKAYVNSAFRIKLDKSQQCKVLERPSLVFGGINPSFIHATETENYLNGKNISDSNTVNIACMKLLAEVDPDVSPPQAIPQYRRILAVSLFYKFVLGLCPEAVSSRNKSGATLLTRPISSDKQDVQTDKSDWPLTQPIPKIDAVLQCSGEAEYVNDIPSVPTELHAALVICDRGPGKITSLDPSEALKIPGVLRFLSAKDIPGKNQLPTTDNKLEELLASDTVPSAGARVGVIIAVSPGLAREAASRVNVVITMSGKPVIDVKKLVQSGMKSRLQLQRQLKAKTQKTDIKYKFNGSYVTDGQYHFYMELQTCLCYPSDIGFNIYCATQCISFLQQTVSTILGISQNLVNVQVKRVGGAYGGKLLNSVRIGAICALASYCMNVPVRMVSPIEICMEALAKRNPFYATYDIGVNGKGEIQYLNADVYSDTGIAQIETVTQFLFAALQGNYNVDTWTVNQYIAYTDLPSNTPARAPGSTEVIAFQEHIMERIAAITGQNSIDVRITNLKSSDVPNVVPMINEIVQSSDMKNRITKIETYNKENRWKKRGMGFAYMGYPYDYNPPFHVIMSVFAGDGTIAITHGGIEMGQGINTKAAQVCARILGIDLNMISVKPTSSLTAPNNYAAAADAPTFGVCYATQQCCNILLERLKPYRSSPTMSWTDLITAANNGQVDLCVEYMFATKNAPQLKSFIVYGVTVSEVEVDVLTGQQQILRVDMIEDCGRSINPELDMGQVQGAFVMGLGYWMTEKLVYNEDTGKLLTNRTWNYTPPTSKDIPIDFRVSFRKNAPNPVGVLRAKVTGEPSLCMAFSVPIAIKNALLSARNDAGLKENWFYFEMPYTPENILLNSKTSVDQFKL